MNNTFKQFKKLNISIVNDTIKLMTDKDHCLEDKHYKDLRDYPVCIVGTVRQRLGLSLKYQVCNSDFCAKCVTLADEFPNPIEMYQDVKETLNSLDNEMFYRFQYERELQENKEKYEGLLLELKQHLRLVHKKELI